MLNASTKIKLCDVSEMDLLDKRVPIVDINEIGTRNI